VKWNKIERKGKNVSQTFSQKNDKLRQLTVYVIHKYGEWSHFALQRWMHNAKNDANSAIFYMSAGNLWHINDSTEASMKCKFSMLTQVLQFSYVHNSALDIYSVIWPTETLLQNRVYLQVSTVSLPHDATLTHKCRGTSKQIPIQRFKINALFYIKVMIFMNRNWSR